MCKAVLSGSECEFSYLNNVVVLPDRVDVYDFQNKLIMTLPQGNQKRDEFEALAFCILDCLDSSFEFRGDDSIFELVSYRSFCNPEGFFHDSPIIHDSLDESLEYIDFLKRMGVNTSGMANFANSYWSTHGKA